MREEDWRAKRTYLFDRLRAIPQGAIEAASTTFLLLIAVQSFDADASAKSLIAAAGNIGLLASLWAVPLAQRWSLPTTRLAGWMMAVGGGAMLGAALLPSLTTLVGASIIAIGAANAIIPLITAAYQENYPPRSRGRWVSQAFVIRVIAAAAFAELAGRLLTADPRLFRLLLGLFGGAFLAAAIFLWQIPSQPLSRASLHGGVALGALRALRFLYTDRTLRWVLSSWMLMGFANLMMLPLRVEFLANPRYGLALNPQQIGFYTVLVPGLVRLALTPIWGRLFDRMEFFVLRILLNTGFALSIAAFFLGTDELGLLLGAALFGAAAAGGEIAWNLGVTKFAPPERVAEYMGVHTFLTGVRGVLAPVVAFWLVELLPISAAALFAAGLIGVASLMLVPEVKGAKGKPQTS
ncbi:MAG: MFS transporter [Anaerolineae bacterium]|nr:MFS transporter [Thermoflexales bacterium]MDW8394830.1 MFS transporter [Anaerolineae bacterium]